jgi:hypothetical protein
MKKQIGSPKSGSKTLGKLENRYHVSKKLAEEGTQRAIMKANKLKSSKTETGKPADPVELDPAKQGMQNTSLTN